MGQPTQQYKRSMTGSIGSGMQSLFGGGGRRYFVLEHKITSRYHKAGEEQKIIVDQVELGRDPRCEVRIDGDLPIFSTVSRHHAAIVRDGENWKLQHLSKTNSTFLNGKRMTSPEWYLQNGDEIQLSENGPKFTFKEPQGEKGLVRSIGLSERLSLFRQQALRPYKTAMSILAAVLVIGLIAGTWIILSQKQQLDEMGGKLVAQNEEFNTRLAQAEAQRLQDSIENAQQSAADRERFQQQIDEANRRTQQAIAAARERNAGASSGLAALIQEQGVMKDVYFLMTDKVVLVCDGEEIELSDGGHPYGWTGTGFLLDDGRFVTARHCIEGWWYQDFSGEDEPQVAARMAASFPDCRMKGYYIAISTLSNTKFTFTSDDFKVNTSLDQKQQLGTNDNGQPIYWNFTFPASSDWNPRMWSTDWAYTTKTQGKRGSISADTQLCDNLLPAQDLLIFGFPQGIGVGDGSQTIDPIFSEVKTSRQGLAKNGCIMHSSGTDHGNSGGPIFAIRDGKLVVVGIVSRGDHRTNEHNWAVPVSALR